MARHGSHAANPFSPTFEAFAKRVDHFRRQYVRGIGRNPSDRLLDLVEHCAFCAADVERARRDPDIPDAIKIGIFREQRLAVRALERAKEARTAGESAIGAYGLAV